jgi:hypothetical protein
MVRPSPDGTLLFWGLPKKALGQSLPWLGAFALLVGMAWGEFRRSIVIVFAVFAGWALPFLLLSWHGGLGSNMRYLLPTLPALCAVAGWLILGLVRRAGGWRPLAAGGLVAAVAAFAWLDLVPGRSAQLHQIVSIYALLGVAGLSLAAGIFARPLLDRGALAGIGAGIGLAMVLAGSDVATSQVVRAEMAVRAATAAKIPGRVVFYGAPKAFAGSVGNPDHLMALPALPERRADAEFLSDACAAGFRVVMPQGFEATSGFEGRQVVSMHDAGAPDGLVELSCSDTPDPAARAALTPRSD